MTFTKDSTKDHTANSNINVVNATVQDIQLPTAGSTLTDKLYKLVTPVNSNKLEELLKGHPNQNLVQYMVNGFKYGFALRYQGLLISRHHHSLPTAYTHKKLLMKCINKEMQLGRILGPFSKPPFQPSICSPVGMVPKKDTDQIRMIMHLSHPKGASINSFIDPAESSTTYQDFQQVVHLVARQGPGAWMGKEDAKSALCNVPM